MMHPRLRHNSRPIDDRLRDESISEHYTSDPSIWARNMDAYDFRCIDDPVPDSIKIQIQNTGSVNPELSKLFSVKDTESYIEIFQMFEGRYHVNIVHTDKNYRNQCHAAYLMREVVNFADENCLELSLSAYPYDEEAKIDLNSLIKFYSEFGFKEEGFVLKDISQDMIRERRC